MAAGRKLGFVRNWQTGSNRRPVGFQRTGVDSIRLVSSLHHEAPTLLEAKSNAPVCAVDARTRRTLDGVPPNPQSVAARA